MTYRNKRLLEACRELPCQHCGAEDGTVVAAHSNQLAHGKGRGLKCADTYVASLCFVCHAELDSGRQWAKEERRDIWNAAHARTLRTMIERGILKI